MDYFKNNIRVYFLKKEKKENVVESPVVTYPTFRGYDEWDCDCYDVVKDKHLTPNKDVYESFISKIVDNYVKTIYKHQNKYVCLNCDKEIS